jgi:2-C-methyl-D-erythritol 4-phosphate cytidylyltransferase
VDAPADGPVWAVVLAAGAGRRYGPNPKQYEVLLEERVIDRSLATARAAADHVVVVLAPGEQAEGDALVESDAARPLASAELHQAVVTAVHAGADGAIPGVAVSDTIKRVGHDERGETVVAETLDRRELVAVQTPQAFRADVLRRAHASGADATDDAGLVEALGGTVVVVPGEPTNLKITGPHDLEVAAALLRAQGSLG